jgi:hypothetical protein
MAPAAHSDSDVERVLAFWLAHHRIPYPLSEEEVRRFWDRGGVPYQIKVDAVRGYGRRFGLRRLIETGTYRGDMVRATLTAFDQITSIELGETLARRAAATFRPYPHVQIINGDSAEVLGHVLANVA